MSGPDKRILKTRHFDLVTAHIALDVQSGQSRKEVARRYGVAKSFVNKCKSSGKLRVRESCEFHLDDFENYLKDPVAYAEKQETYNARRRHVFTVNKKREACDRYEIMDSSTLAITRAFESSVQLICFSDHDELMKVFEKGLHGDSEVIASQGNVSYMKRRSWLN